MHSILHFRLFPAVGDRQLRSQRPGSSVTFEESRGTKTPGYFLVFAATLLSSAPRLFFSFKNDAPECSQKNLLNPPKPLFKTHFTFPAGGRRCGSRSDRIPMIAGSNSRMVHIVFLLQDIECFKKQRPCICASNTARRHPFR